ncbi:transposase [Streptomyces sp. A1136]|uniref:transposase n=1 Tax=Streptomyces sp. A1136 TaxID=2563102 RepID=UPI00109EE062|nr:transposase [Streptomyces sp. A1136]
MNHPGDLDDQEWHAVRTLLPRHVPSGPDYRTIVNGILWQQSGGRRWHDLPTRYGPWHRRRTPTPVEHRRHLAEDPHPPRHQPCPPPRHRQPPNTGRERGRTRRRRLEHPLAHISPQSRPPGRQCAHSPSTTDDALVDTLLGDEPDPLNAPASI